MVQKPAPTPNADTKPFWEACSRGELVYQRCRGCGRPQFFPRSICSHCRGSDLEWKASAGKGAVYTFTVNHRPPNPAFEEDVPYVIALVDLDEGFRMMMNVRGCDPEAVRIGMRVRVTFEARGEQKIPQALPEA